jgi:hypothetical protein
MATKPKPTTKSDLELRRWCIEQARGWAWSAGNSSQGAVYPHPGSPASEPDLIGRADRILAWVTKART